MEEGKSPFRWVQNIPLQHCHHPLFLFCSCVQTCVLWRGQHLKWVLNIATFQVRLLDWSHISKSLFHCLCGNSREYCGLFCGWFNFGGQWMHLLWDLNEEDSKESMNWVNHTVLLWITSKWPDNWCLLHLSAYSLLMKGRHSRSSVLQKFSRRMPFLTQLSWARKVWRRENEW